MTIAIGFTAAFIAGIFIGAIGALKCVKFGIRAAYEARSGNQGLFPDKDNVDAEFEMLDEKEKVTKNE